MVFSDSEDILHTLSVLSASFYLVWEKYSEIFFAKTEYPFK